MVSVKSSMGSAESVVYWRCSCKDSAPWTDDHQMVKTASNREDFQYSSIHHIQSLRSKPVTIFFPSVLSPSSNLFCDHLIIYILCKIVQTVRFFDSKRVQKNLRQRLL